MKHDKSKDINMPSSGSPSDKGLRRDDVESSSSSGRVDSSGSSSGSSNRGGSSGRIREKGSSSDIPGNL